MLALHHHPLNGTPMPPPVAHRLPLSVDSPPRLHPDVDQFFSHSAWRGEHADPRHSPAACSILSNQPRRRRQSTTTAVSSRWEAGEGAAERVQGEGGEPPRQAEMEAALATEAGAGIQPPSTPRCLRLRVRLEEARMVSLAPRDNIMAQGPMSTPSTAACTAITTTTTPITSRLGMARAAVEALASTARGV